jgi:PIN domain nuclease of toxin-antitoxin system
MISSRVVTDVRLLLDTVTFIYAIEAPSKLGRKAAAALDDPENIVELSTISLAEIAIKVSKGKLVLPLRLVRDAVADLDLRLLAYTAEHAFRLFDLPPHHRDPFDRQIIAQALTEEVPVVTSDEAFRRYEGLRLLW